MKDESDIKKSFYLHFNNEMKKEGVMPFFYEIFTISTAFVVGGFFRDFLLNKPSRDIDIIVDLENDTLLNIINNNNLIYTTNRHGGIKIKLSTKEIDIWSIYNNWAFKNNLVKLNEADKLHSIAKGCFYNYDSVVINLTNYHYNLRYFREFVTTKKLNILQENSIYKNLNPSIEANILRALYLIKEYNATLTINTYYYLLNKLGDFTDRNINVVEQLINVKSYYPKYKSIEEKDIIIFLNFLRKDYNPNSQIILDI